MSYDVTISSAVLHGLIDLARGVSVPMDMTMWRDTVIARGEEALADSDPASSGRGGFDG